MVIFGERERSNQTVYCVRLARAFAVGMRRRQRRAVAASARDRDRLRRRQVLSSIVRDRLLRKFKLRQRRLHRAGQVVLMSSRDVKDWWLRHCRKRQVFDNQLGRNIRTCLELNRSFLDASPVINAPHLRGAGGVDLDPVIKEVVGQPQNLHAWY